jgi:hypothetical protein
LRIFRDSAEDARKNGKNAVAGRWRRVAVAARYTLFRVIIAIFSGHLRKWSMSTINMGWVVAGLAGVLWFGSFTARAQKDRRLDPGAAPNAPAVTQSKSEAGPAASSKPLDQLDPQLRLVSVDLLLAEIGSPKGEAAKPGLVEKELDARDLTGPMGEVLAKVEALKKTGRISYFRRIQLSALEGQQALVNIGETKPMVTGVSLTGAGRVSKNIIYRSTGTMVKITSRVTADDRVMMDLSLEDSRVRAPEDGVSVGTDENGQPIPAMETTMAKLDTRLSVRSGQATAQAVQTATKGGQEQMFVVVAARIVEPDAKRNK